LRKSNWAALVSASVVSIMVLSSLAGMTIGSGAVIAAP
jgi:hypothetical protein